MDNSRVPVTLIVGSEGMIGGALGHRLSLAGKKVVGADILEVQKSNYIHLDLEGRIADWTPPWPVEIAYLCAGITSLDKCRQNPDEASAINVFGICTLAEILVSKGAFVVFLSSNRVFDGTRPHTLANSAYGPMTAYGMQKAEAEKRIRALGAASAIVRLTKVIGEKSLFSEWVEVLKRGMQITPFSDMVLAPVPLNTVVTVLQLVGEMKQTGLWQISGDQDISYAEAAEFIANELTVNPELIKPIPVSISGIDIEHNPRHTSLDGNRLADVLGIVPPSIHKTIKQAIYLKTRNN